MCLKLLLKVNFNVCVVQVPWQIQKPKHLMEHVHTVVKSCVCRHHVSKDFSTPVINEVCVAVKKGSLVVEHMPFRCCLLLLQTETIMATVRASCHYSNDLLQGGLEDHLLHFFIYYDCSLAESCAVITKSTLVQGNFWHIILLNTAATPFSNCNVMQRK